MIMHAGVDKTGRYHGTICGLTVPARRAPYSQPVSSITCKRCRKSVVAAMERTRAQMLYGLTHNPNYLASIKEEK